VPEAVAPAAWAVVVGGADVEGRAGATISGRQGRAIVLALELPRALPHDRYCLRYLPPLGPVGGSEVSPTDWSF
jgi:hypothetical protein